MSEYKGRKYQESTRPMPNGTSFPAERPKAPKEQERMPSAYIVRSSDGRFFSMAWKEKPAELLEDRKGVLYDFEWGQKQLSLAKVAFPAIEFDLVEFLQVDGRYDLPPQKKFVTA